VLQPTSVQYFDRGGIFEIERPEWPGWISGPDKTGNSSNWGSNAKHGLHGRSLASTTTDLKKRQNRLAAALPTLRRRQAIAGGGGDPRSMVPVRLAGAEVTGAFWASAAGDYCGCARRGNSLVGLRFPERITQITNAAEVLPFVVDRHPEPRIVLQSEFVAVVANERAARIDLHHGAIIWTKIPTAVDASAPFSQTTCGLPPASPRVQAWRRKYGFDVTWVLLMFSTARHGENEFC